MPTKYSPFSHDSMTSNGMRSPAFLCEDTLVLRCREGLSLRASFSAASGILLGSFFVMVKMFLGRWFRSVMSSVSCCHLLCSLPCGCHLPGDWEQLRPT